MKHFKTLTVLMLLAFAGAAQAQSDSRREEIRAEFAADVLPELLQANGASLIENSIRFSEPVLFATERRLNPLESIPAMWQGYKFCYKVHFQARQGGKVKNGETFIYMHGSDEDRNDMKYERQYDWVQVHLANGCWGLESETEPRLSLTEARP